MKAYRAHVMVCGGTGCVGNGSYEVKQALQREIEARGLADEVLVLSAGCRAFCSAGPIVVHHPDNIFYQKVTVADVPRLVEEHLLKGRPVPELMYSPADEEVLIPKLGDIPFFSKQTLLTLRNRGQIDPENIEEYIGRGGYDGLAKALTQMKPREIIEEVKRSGLRGRGGAGFPTGRKWEMLTQQPGDTKFIVCNGDEGDAGAFMDRSIIEADPQSLIEGMVIGAYAMGVNRGFVYIRNEYPLPLDRMHSAIEQARDYGLLGDDILGTGFSFDAEIVRGAGAFVCGEETALLASVEGRLGEPRTKPPYPVQDGLWGHPTVINNVETWANVPMIIARGADWFNSIGTETSKGTKVFSLVGKINNTGLIEVPMGISLREIIYDIGGGIPRGRKFKAVQTGGPSGGCIPAELLDLPVDYESLTEAGSMMGSGGLVVMDEDTCMVDVARFFLEFTKDESCGKCTPCREGTRQMLQILDRICDGEGREGDIELLEELGEAVVTGSLCGLGKTAPNPVLSTIRYFRDEYEAHIKYKRCPAAVCKGLISSPCQHTCPVGQDVPVYVGFIAKGMFREAAEIIRQENPLPSICGRVCHNPCELKCFRNQVDDPVAIRALKRFAVDWEIASGAKPKVPRPAQTYEPVAIVGAGPAGLAAGYFLARDGYQVTIFEKAPKPGGMLALGIPDYRLPKDILKRDIDFIKEAGVKIQTDTEIGKDITLDGLFDRGFKAVLLAVGAHQGMKLGIPGEDLEGATDAIEFLWEVNLGRSPKVGDKVVVVGGGDAAIDAARTARRMGKQVTILYRRTRAEMPARAEEIEDAIEEGIDIQFLAAPIKCHGENGKLTAIECIRMQLGEPDESGRRRPVPVERSEYRIELDTLIPAIGQRPEVSFLEGVKGINVTPWGTIVADPETLATEREGIFAGGDAVSGPATVVDAEAMGKVAADMIHKYLRGMPLTREYRVTRPALEVEAVELSDEEIETLVKRIPIPRISLDARVRGFGEVESAYGEADAVREAKRCLRCDLDLAAEESVGAEKEPVDASARGGR